MPADLTPYVPRLLTEWAAGDEGGTHAAIEGSLAFADVSGFTRLSERLAKAGGKAGAEQLTDIISFLFGELLSVASSRGGEMLKYGGDAMLLFFRGDDHAVRAAAACALMQRRLKEIGRIDTGSGVVRLRMSVGVHSGDFDMFVVGGSHRELVVAGPAATTTAAMETAAEATEILVSADTAALLAGRSLGVERAGGRLLRGVPDAPEVPVVGRDPDPGASRFVSVGLRRHLEDGIVDAEHRLVTQAFVNIVGLDDVLDSEGPAAAAEQLHDTMVVIQDACERYDVCFLASDIAPNGTKVIAVAGAPLASDAPEQGVVRALRHVIDAEPPLKVRAGVHRGHVFTGDVGPPFRRTYTTMGDVTNTAARVMAHAPAGDALTLRDVAAIVGRDFELEQLPAFHAKGKSEALVPFRIGVARDRPSEFAPGASTLPFTGRSDDLAVLEDAARAARDGVGTVFEIAGDIGIGKSRLVHELLARCGGVQRRVLLCEPYEATTPYFPFRHLLRAVLGIGGRAGEAALHTSVGSIDTSLLPWLPLVGDVAGIDVGPTAETSLLADRFRRQKTSIVVMDLLTKILTEPTILVFEDVQWADEASVQLLNHVAAQVRDHRWLIVATRRSGAADVITTGSVGRLDLTPLDAQDVSAIMASAAAAPLPPHRRSVIASRAGGNPLFLEALLATQAAAGDEDLPGSIEAVMARQLDSRASTQRRHLRTAAVLGTSFDLDLFRAVTGDEPDGGFGAEELSAMLDGMLLAEAGDRLRFRHHLLRDVAYERIPYRDRRELHGRAATALEATMAGEYDDRLGVLSWHQWHARRFEECWHSSRDAAVGAVKKLANVEAVELFGRAIASARRCAIAADETAPTWELLGDAAFVCGMLARSASAYREARKLCRQRPVRTARLCRKEALLAERLGRRRAARTWLARGLRSLHGDTTVDGGVERASILVALAWSRRADSRPAEAAELARDAVHTASAVGARHALANAYTALDASLSALGRFDEATHSAEALQIFDELGAVADKAITLNSAGGDAYYRGEWSQATRLFAQAADEHERAGNAIGAGIAKMNCAEILCDQGDVAASSGIVDEVEGLWSSVGFDVGVGHVLAQRGRLELRRGNAPQAAELLGRASDELHRHGLVLEAVTVDAARAECLLALGRTSVAEELVASTLRHPRSAGAPGVRAALHRLRAYVHLARPDPAAAAEAAAESVDRARLDGSRYSLALSLQAQAAVARASGSADDAAESEMRQLFESLGVVAPPAAPRSASRPRSG